MKSFNDQARVYASYHQNIKTRYAHMAGTPIIILSTLIFLGFVKIIVPGVFATNFACLATVIALIYYFRLNWQLALALTPIMLILLLIGNWFSQDGPTKFALWSFIVFFLLGWGLHLYGHYMEKDKPALMNTLYLERIAPLYFVAELFFMAGFMQSLKAQIYDRDIENIK